MSTLTLPETKNDWKVLLKSDAKDSVNSILRQGLHIYQYSLTCPTVSGGSTFKRDINAWLGYSSPTATVWCNIGKKYQSLLNSTNHLPLSYFSIAELTKLKDTEFKGAIQSGDIHPGMSQSDVKQLRDEIDKERLQKRMDAEKKETEKKTAGFNPADFLGNKSKRVEQEDKPPDNNPDKPPEPIKKEVPPIKPKESPDFTAAKRHVYKLFDLMQNKLTDNETVALFELINPMFCDGED